MLYPLYSFDAPEGPYDDDPLAGVLPLPEPVQIRHVYRHDRLLELMEEGDTAAAFYQWASESLGLYDHAHKLAEVRELDVNALEAARGQYERTLAESGRNWNEIRPLLLDAIGPFLESGLSMRAIANYTGRPLSEIVLVIVPGTSAKNAERLATVEEALLDNALERMSIRALMREHGLSNDASIKTLCALHNIDRTPKRATSHADAA